MPLNNLFAGRRRSKKDPAAAMDHMKQGNSLSQQGDLDAALTHYREALSLFDEDTHYQEMATCYSSLGNILRTKGDHEGALAALQKAIDAQRAHGADNPLTARALANLAVIHQLKGDQEAALTANEDALKVSQAVFGINHGETAQLCNNRGLMLRSKGEYEAALEQHHKALAIYLDQQDHVSMGTAYNNIAKVHWHQKNYNRALEMLGSAQEMYMVGGLTDDHPLMANTLNNVALIMADKGDYKVALGIHKKALALRENRLGKDHPQGAETLADMGRVAHGLGNPEEALRYFERAIQIQQQRLGSNHTKTQETQTWIEKCTSTMDTQAA